MTTGVPATARRNMRVMALFAIRMHPWETAPPSKCGWFVPWIAIGPPCIQCCRTGENAETPIAAGP